MSIEAKHSYRFGFLKSEKWQQIRLDTLVRFEGLCFLCGLEKFNNDVHHVVYPDKLEESGVQHLVVLCRTCHKFIHGFMDHRKIESPSRRWKVLKAIVKCLGKVDPDAPDVRTKENKQKRKELAIAIASCNGCGTLHGSEKRNPFHLVGLVWFTALCEDCWIKSSAFMLNNKERIDSESKHYALVKKFFKTLKMPIDNGS